MNELEPPVVMDSEVSNSIHSIRCNFCESVEDNQRCSAIENIVWLKRQQYYDNVTVLAQSIFNAPIVLISIVSKKHQWFKSKRGLTINSTPREQSFCAHTLNMKTGMFLLVNDATKDPRFKDNPLVVGPPYIRFYFGVPLISPQGIHIGALCVIDSKPREVSAEQVDAMRVLQDHLCDYFETPISIWKKIKNWCLRIIP